MKDYYFRLVCVNEYNILEYEILEDVNVGNLTEVHKYVEEHIQQHLIKNAKWMLIPVKRSYAKIV